MATQPETTEADGTITMNPGVGGQSMDATSVTRADGTIVVRERVDLGTSDGGAVQTQNVSGTQYLPVTEATAGAILDAQLETNRLLAAILDELKEGL